MRGIGREAAGTGSDLDDRRVVVLGRMTQSQEERPVGLLRVDAEDEHRRTGIAGLVDRGARKAEDDRGVDPVAHLGVDVVGPQHRLGELRPGVLRFVRETSAAEDRDAAGVDAVERRRRLRECSWP